MNWFSRTTSIAGIQVSNWILVIVAVVVLWIIYSFVAHCNTQSRFFDRLGRRKAERGGVILSGLLTTIPKQRRADGNGRDQFGRAKRTLLTQPNTQSKNRHSGREWQTRQMP
jgi:hypothetical protein